MKIQMSFVRRSGGETTWNCLVCDEFLIIIGEHGLKSLLGTLLIPVRGIMAQLLFTSRDFVFPPGPRGVLESGKLLCPRGLERKAGLRPVPGGRLLLEVRGPGLGTQTASCHLDASLPCSLEAEGRTADMSGRRDQCCSLPEARDPMGCRALPQDRELSGPKCQ